MRAYTIMLIMERGLIVGWLNIGLGSKALKYIYL